MAEQVVPRFCLSSPCGRDDRATGALLVACLPFCAFCVFGTFGPRLRFEHFGLALSFLPSLALPCTLHPWSEVLAAAQAIAEFVGFSLQQMRVFPTSAF